MGRHEPAEAPARHGKVFGEAVLDNGIVVVRVSSVSLLVLYCIKPPSILLHRVSKETYYIAKRDLLHSQKRPTSTLLHKASQYFTT